MRACSRLEGLAQGSNAIARLGTRRKVKTGPPWWAGLRPGQLAKRGLGRSRIGGKGLATAEINANRLRPNPHYSLKCWDLTLS